MLTSENDHEVGHLVQQVSVGEELPLGRQVVRVQDGGLQNISLFIQNLELDSVFHLTEILILS